MEESKQCFSRFTSTNSKHEYLLLTAAHNEKAYIERAILSVVGQSLLPKHWLIVDDASTDGTNDVIQKYAKKHDFIRVLRLDRAPGRSFGSKVIALRAGSKCLEGISSDFIGNLDADVTVEPSYFKSLINNFNRDPQLGVAAGFVYEETRGHFVSYNGNRSYSVVHAAQLMRRDCYERIGGYAVLEYGGEDWHAQVSLEMMGWTAAAFPDLKIFHHRRTGEAGHLVQHSFQQGRMDYGFGSHPLFEMLKCLRRASTRPFLIGAIARLLGFLWSSVRKEARPVSNEFVGFLRNQQRQRMLHF